MVVVREVKCQFSNTCNRSVDYSCSSAAFFNSSCQRGERHLCLATSIAVDTYDDVECTGAPIRRATEFKDNCTMNSNHMYVGHYCDVHEAPVSGRALRRTVCPNGCDTGSECARVSLITGRCAPNPLSYLGGRNIVAWCFAEYGLFITDDDSNCRGDPVGGLTEPVGPKCFLDENQFHIQNLCQ